VNAAYTSAATSMWMPWRGRPPRAGRSCSISGGRAVPYRGLLGPIDALIKDKPDLIIVPTGALIALPFRLLVTEQSAVAVPKLENISTYRVVYFATHGSSPAR
jgi:hypothetical protein